MSPKIDFYFLGLFTKTAFSLRVSPICMLHLIVSYYTYISSLAGNVRSRPPLNSGQNKTARICQRDVMPAGKKQLQQQQQYFYTTATFIRTHTESTAESLCVCTINIQIQFARQNRAVQSSTTTSFLKTFLGGNNDQERKDGHISHQ